MGGNNSKKLAAKCSFLSKDEQIVVSTSFKIVSKNSETFKETDIVKLWGAQIDPRLSHYIVNFLFGSGDTRQTAVELEKFAELYVFAMRGSSDERLYVLLKCLGLYEENEDENEHVIPYESIKEFVESIVASFMKIQKCSNTKQYKSWTSRGSFTSSQNVQKLAESLTYSLLDTRITRTSLRKWIYVCTTLGVLLNHVFNHLFGITHKEKVREPSSSSTAYYPSQDYDPVDRDKDKNLIPLCRGLDLIPSYPSLLDLNQLVFVNSNLPAEYQYEWRFLFSSQIHGESFSTLIGRVVNQGPCVLVLEDNHGYMFGGFASVAWNISPLWCGNDSSFLFTLTPKMRVFPPTGYNDHFQYLNLHQQTMSNGLAMGGQHNYYGLWLDCEYGRGASSETCTTYKDYFQLSHDKQFTFKHLEVWGLGNVLCAHQEPDNSNNTCLNDREARAMLELAGKTMHSDGYRNVAPNA